MQPSYSEFRPKVASIEACWSLDVPPETAAGHRHPVLPDGCIDLIWRRRRDASGIAAGELLISAPTVHPAIVPLCPGDTFVGVRFRPGWGTTCLTVSAADLADGTLDAARVSARFRRLRDRLDVVDGRAAAARRLLAAAADCTDAAALPTRALEAIDRLATSAGRMPLPEVARATGISLRTLRRELDAAAGLSPKALARVFRFRHALRLRAGSPPGGDAGVAHEAGYADQAHMIREFRALAGTTPGRLDLAA